MNRTFTLFLLLFFCPFQLVIAQKDYFQQEVHYDVNVTLDDVNHTLTGHINIEYQNNAPHGLNFLYFHLWPNAYRSKKTAYAKQALRYRETDFFFSNPGDGGSISGLDFITNGKPINWALDETNPDIAKLNLTSPLGPGERITISTGFKVKLPLTFSRLGHDNNAYQISQWYPKPAVYDSEGWHPMPYLELGEYYSEFGSFDVKITLPKNYVVGATGVLQTVSEQEWLAQKVLDTNKLLEGGFSGDMSFPPSSPELKTVRFTADKVHDFAWFADKRFHVQKSQVKLSSGRKIDTWAMFTNLEARLWTKAIDYINRSIQFYSETVGEYPYAQATAVESSLAAGGGMEYPMITVIANAGTAQSLDRIITHEIGHNWFYAVLGSNERDHPWMDEGLNSFYENRYMKRYYELPNGDMFNQSAERFLGAGAAFNPNELFYQFLGARNLDQAPDGNANNFSSMAYYFGAYSKPAMIMQMLEAYIGNKTLDRAMQQYFQQWAFRHPGPQDFRSALERSTNLDLSWFFDGFLFTNKKMDYALAGFRKGDQFAIDIINKGDIAAPFPISGIRAGEVVETKWYEGFTGKKTISFPLGAYDKLILDTNLNTLDINRRNNILKLSGAFKKAEPLKLKFLGGLDHPQKSMLYWFPLLAGNHYDKATVGLALYNRAVPAKALEFAIAPMFALGTKDLTGLAHLKYNWYPNTKGFQKISLGLGWKSFHYDYNELHDYHLKYQRLMPSLRVNLGKRPTSNLEQILQLRSIFLFEDIARFDTSGTYIGNNVERSTINELSYSLERISAVNPFYFRVALEQQQYKSFFGQQEQYLKASVELKTSYTYQKDKNIDFRFFAGFFLDNTRRNAGNVANRGTRGGVALTSQGFTDYKYDEFYFGRNENTGLWSQQISIKDGGMKNAFGGSFGIGLSNDYILAMNIKSDLPKNLPLNLPIKPFFDVGFFHNAQPTGSDDSFKDQLLWSGGVMLEFGKKLFRDGVFNIYFPIVNSDNLKLQYGSRSEGKYSARITFSLDLNRVNPWELVDGITF